MKQDAPLNLLIEISYFPPVQVYSKFFLFEQVVFEMYENYQKTGFRNRCLINSPNGAQTLSVPLKKGKNEQQPIKEVRIAYDEPWQKHHWQAILTAYKSAPFFDFYADFFEPVFQKKFEFLIDLDLEILEFFFNQIPPACLVGYTEKFEKAVYSTRVLDYRNQIKPKTRDQNPDPLFLPSPYPQVFEYKHGFVSHLSVLDLLFCTGPEAFLYLQKMVPHSEKPK